MLPPAVHTALEYDRLAAPEPTPDEDCEWKRKSHS
jgi:hypothetical protein